MSYYHINNVHLTLQPSKGRWLDREVLGVTGSGHGVYSDFRQFEMSWDIINVSELDQIQGYFNVFGSSGTVSVDLPTYKTSTYGFTTYSGCVIREPTFSEYFEESPTSVSLLVVNIKTA